MKVKELIEILTETNCDAEVFVQYTCPESSMDKITKVSTENQENFISIIYGS